MKSSDKYICVGYNKKTLIHVQYSEYHPNVWEFCNHLYILFERVIKFFEAQFIVEKTEHGEW